jgi:pimeloyl-ACP methyl ester carboxylesterase
MKILKLWLIVSLLAGLSAHAQVFDVPYGGDAPTRTLLVPAKNPKALVILFPGGEGRPQISENGEIKSQHTFIRSKSLWAQYGIDAVLVDSPYSLGNSRNNSRGTKDHQQRILSVIKFYQNRNLPIWLFGHSMGTVSVTEFANDVIENQKLISGVIIAGSYRSISLSKEFKLPALGIHHELDGCSATPLSATKSALEGRDNSTKSKFIMIEGGKSEGDECQSFSYHGFNQKEDELVKVSADFILSR